MLTFIGTRTPTNRKTTNPRITVEHTVNQVLEKRWTLSFHPTARRRQQVYSRLGFDWGTQPDGTTTGGTIETARTILRTLYPYGSPVQNEKIYQAFAQEVISKLPAERFTLTDVDIQKWVRKTMGEA